MADDKIQACGKSRFEAVSLAFNVGEGNIRNIGGKVGPIGELMDCNPGGSVICPAGTGCPPGTCVGTSCSGASATQQLGLDARILVAHEDLAQLQQELQSVVNKFIR